MHIRGSDLLSIRDQLGHSHVQTTLDHYIAHTPKIHRHKYDRYTPSYRSPGQEAAKQILLIRDGDADILNTEASHTPCPSMPVIIEFQGRTAKNILTPALERGAIPLAISPTGSRIRRKKPIQAPLFLNDQDFVDVEYCEASSTIGTNKPRGSKSIADKLQTVEMPTPVIRRQVFPDVKTVKSGQKRQEVCPPVQDAGSRLTLTHKPRLNVRQKAALSNIKENDTNMTNRSYRQITGATQKVAATDLANLCKRGILIREGQTRSTRYFLTVLGKELA